MRAVVARGPGAFAVEEVPEPVVPPGGRLVHVEAAGVCAADRKLYTGDHPWGELDWPFTPGHELLGVDDATGERITCEVKVPCGRCKHCVGGWENLCPTGAHLGLELAGTFAERLALLSDVDHDGVVTATRSLEELETALRPVWAPRVKEVLVP